MKIGLISSMVVKTKQRKFYDKHPRPRPSFLYAQKDFSSFPAIPYISKEYSGLVCPTGRDNVSDNAIDKQSDLILGSSRRATQKNLH